MSGRPSLALTVEIPTTLNASLTGQHASIPMARQFGLALAPWDAIGSGRLLSKKQLEARLASGEKMRGQGGNVQTEMERKYSEVLEEVGKEHNVDSVTAVALACESLWTLCA